MRGAQSAQLLSERGLAILTHQNILTIVIEKFVHQFPGFQKELLHENVPFHAVLLGGERLFPPGLRLHRQIFT